MARKHGFYRPHIGGLTAISSTTVKEGVGGALNAFSAIKQKIADGAADVVIIAPGDSTSNETTEFIYLWFAAIAALNPTHTFEYYPPDGAGGYGSVSTVSTGSGSRKVKLYNPAIAGAIVQQFQGSVFATTFATTPDLIIWNFAKNHVSAIAAGPLVYPLAYGEMFGAWVDAQVAFPNAHHAVVMQYPNRDNALVGLFADLWAYVRTNWPEALLIDLYNRTYVFGDYTDNNHLTASANTALLLPIMMEYWNAARVGAFAPAAVWTATKVANQLDGDSVNYTTRSQVYGDFNDAAAGASVPSNWTIAAGSPVFADEATIVVAPRTKAVKMTGTGSGVRISRVPTAARRAAMAGQTVFLLVQQRIVSGANNTVGRVALRYTAPSVNGGAQNNITTRSMLYARDAYYTACIGPVFIPADVSQLDVLLYYDSAAAPDTEAVYRQKAVLSIGNVPRDTL